MSDDAYSVALRNWINNPGNPRPRQRPDGIPTRNDMQFMTAAERSITDAMHQVERAGASEALTDAVNLLSKARDRVADHVERCMLCSGRGKVTANNPARAKAWEVPCPDCAPQRSL